jgi:hypothetical protein
VFPGLFLVLTTLSFNLVGDGLRDAFGTVRAMTQSKQRGEEVMPAAGDTFTARRWSIF